MNNFWAYFVFILGLIMIAIASSYPGYHYGLIGIIFVVWGLYSIIANAKKEIIDEIKHK